MTNIVRGGFPVAGAPVGILCISTRHPLLPGNVQHAASFPRPVLYEVVPIEDSKALMAGDERLIEPILAGARRLVALGAKAVVGACGSFAYYQRAVAAALPVPVFLSIMTQVPLVQLALGRAQKLCVICAAASALTPRVFEQCGIAEPDRLVIREMRGGSEFNKILAGDIAFDAAGMETEAVTLAKDALAAEPGIGAFLLQCSDLPPFGRAIGQATGLPVFDMTLMIRWLQEAVAYPAYPAS